MRKEVRVLDHGFIKIHNISGPTRRPEAEFDAHDTDPANVARMSFGNMNSDRTAEDDAKLADYLMRNWHTGPFEMIEIWVEMKLPIFTARQFVRHRTVGLNEISGRYVQLPAEWYIPQIVGGKAPNVKQGQADNLSELDQRSFKLALNNHCEQGYDNYTFAIANGVAAEHARLFLSVNHYTHWMWKQDLHNMMHFLALRKDNHAQIEAQQYAAAIIDELRSALPLSMALFDKYRAIK